MLDSRFQKQLIRLQFPAEYDSGNFAGKKSFINLLFAGFRKSFHISIFYKTNDLQSGGLEMLKVPGHLKCRSVDIRLCDLNFGNIQLRCQIFQFHLFNDLFQFYACHALLRSFPFPSADRRLLMQIVYHIKA